MKNVQLFLLIFLLPLFAVAQDGQQIKFGGSRPQDTAYAARSLRIDSVVRLLKYATIDTNKVVGFDANGFMVLRTKGNGSGTAIDTGNISTRIDARVKYSDTSAMLSPYARTAAIPSITGKVNYTDTAAMLGGYLRKIDTTALSTRIDAKLNITDTANIRLRPIAGTNVTITGTYPNLTFNSSAGGGGVTSIATTNGTGITGGTITTTGTLALDTANTVVTKSYRKKGIDSLNVNIALKANIASPTFTGVPAAPTAAANTNTTQIATTAHVFAERANTATLTNKTLTSPSIATPLITGVSSGTTNDSLLVSDPSTGAVRRISSARISSGGGGTDVNAFHYTGDAFVGSMRLGASGTGTRRLSMYLNSDTLLRLGVTTAGFRWAVINSNNGVANNYDATVVGGEGGNASGIRSIVLGGPYGQAQGTNSISMGGGIAESTNSWAWGGNSTYANGANSIAFGNYANNNNYTGCFNWADFGYAGFRNNTANNQAMLSPLGGMVVNCTTGTPTYRVNAALHIESSAKGLLVPRLTTAERDAVTWVADDEGMIIFNKTTKKHQGWNGTTWNDCY